MQIQITGRHIEITEPMKSFVQQKFSRLSRHFDSITQVNVTLKVENKINHIAKAVIILANTEIVAHCSAKDMYEAIDKLMDKLNRQIIRYKENMTNH